MIVFRTKAESMNPAAAAAAMAISWNRTKSLELWNSYASPLQYLISTNWIELDKPYMLVPILQ